LSHNSPKKIIHSEKAFESFIRWIAEKSISFGSFQLSYFQKFIGIISGNFKLPCYRTLKKRIADISLQIQSKPLVSDHSVHYCSLVIDGVTKVGHHFLAAMLFLQKRYIFTIHLIW
jgi:hypothetical protein